MKLNRSCARRYGGDRVPKQPEEITGWEVPENIQLQEHPHRILIFATDAMRMGRTRNYFSAGCFKDIPIPFHTWNSGMFYLPLQKHPSYIP